MAEVDLNELERKYAAATPGAVVATMNVPATAQDFQWDFTHDQLIALVAERIRKGGSRLFCVTLDAKMVVLADTGNGSASEANAKWFAAVHNAFPALLTELRAARALREACIGTNYPPQVATALVAYNAAVNEAGEVRRG